MNCSRIRSLLFGCAILVLLFIVVYYSNYANTSLLQTNSLDLLWKSNSSTIPNECCTRSRGLSLETYCNGSDNLDVVLPGCSCMHVLLCRMVAVMCISSNHFKEAQDAIGSVQKYFPHTTIIVYDLGLSDSERSKLGAYCNVEVRPFSFKGYPAHVRNLYTYAWKPVIISEAARQHEVILYGDASARLKSSDITAIMKSLVKFPFVGGSDHVMPLVSFTHDGMLEYLRTPSRKELASFSGTEANVWLMWANSLMKERLIAPWLDCALHKECIAPAGTSRWWCRFNNDAFKNGRYIGCHRFDQSALNMILAREFGISILRVFMNQSVSGPMWEVDRASTHRFPVYKCA